jgi:hypothetical protein
MSELMHFIQRIYILIPTSSIYLYMEKTYLNELVCMRFTIGWSTVTIQILKNIDWRRRAAEATSFF